MTARWAVWAAGLRRLLLGGWLGALAGFSFLVAPTLFRVLRAAGPDRASPAPNALAGDVVVPVLQGLASWGLVLGLLTLALLHVDPERRHIRWRVGGILLALLCVVASRAWLTPTMLDLLQQMAAPVDALPPTHPLRARFDGMHGYSSGLHLGMLLGVAAALWFERDHSTR
ncbi:MAG: DUF4149 domain-containing protein [Deltaproteobacteria bacterium]|nr:DUF4149 domain-containing protein [Deltaproteobacteria bacterium]